MAGSRSAIGIVAALAVGSVAGWTVARITGETRAGESRAVPPIPRAETARAEEDTAELVAPERAHVPLQEAAEDRVPSATEVLLIHPGLEEHGREGIRRGWLAVRKGEIPDALLEEGLSEYERVVLDSPEAIGRRLATRENERDAVRADAATGGVFALIATLNDGSAGPMPELVADAESFSRFFPRAAPERGVNGMNHLAKPDEAIEDGTTLSFPAGVFRLERLMEDKDPFPRDVTVSGAGMDATLLIFGDLSTRHRLRNFTVRDCTLFTGDDYAFDLRVEPASIQFDRVRVCGFDMGAGSSCMLQAPGAAFYARGCHIVGGYGRSPTSGQLFRVDAPGLLARFENCRLELVDIGHRRLEQGATVAFVNCVMKDILSWGPPPKELDHPGIVLAGTVIDWIDYSRTKPEKKDLNDLFPDWKARINQ